MKKQMLRLSALLLCLLMLCTAAPLSVFAADDPMKVVLSLEGFTLGEGYFVEPTEYTVSQINDLVKKDGYGPFTEDTLTAGMATLAMFNDKGLTAALGEGATWTKGTYIDYIADIDNGNVDFPAVITANGGPSNATYTHNTDKNLGSYDYTSYSGWMSYVNNKSLSVTVSDFVLKRDAAADYGNTYVIRWQFTLIGYGRDHGFGYKDWYTGEYIPGFFEAANKDKAMIAYAESSNASAKAAAKPVLEKLDATQSEVDGTIDALNKPEEKAPTFWERIVAFFNRIVDFFKNLFKR